MYKIIESQSLVPNMHLLTIEAPEVASAIQPGQFVILRVDEEGERIPLTASDWDSVLGTVTLVFMVIGRTTHQLSELHVGDTIPTFAGPLGNALVFSEFGTVMLVGGCYGIGSIYPLAKALKQNNNRIVTVIEARSSNLFFWQEKLKSVSDNMFYITRDGTQGRTGHVTKNLPEIIKTVRSGVDRVYVNGCNFMMMRVSQITRSSGIPTQVSLNTIMIDGTGMCGVCRVTVDGKMKFACVDGPYFDGHQVNWVELAQRRQMYLREEGIPLRTSAPEARIDKKLGRNIGRR
jgi:NAD(P)H-flavin reductase